MHLTQTAGPGRKILRKGKYMPPFHKTMAGDDTVRRYINLFHAEIYTPVNDEHVDFPKRTRIKK